MFPTRTGRRSHERNAHERETVQVHLLLQQFQSQAAAGGHERTHTQERPFVCPLCGKSLPRRTSFKTHQFLHTGEKPYKCRSCSRSFAQKSNLTDHFRSIHSQEKPYECTVCSAKFTRSTSRKVHMEKKHGLAITVRQGRPPTHESNPTVDSIVATCLSIDVGSVLTPTEHQTLGDSFSMIVNNLTS
ncbi:putative zinc finger protein [Apostichopus japonicus]|uniref:Putative zinc finger protein n=1 Tax=Stichopus japonicus TaxID=307972 RepID=A0A2G8KH00_STIJA|nr:putative zinc finger protein [Apostichopus japonicus]